MTPAKSYTEAKTQVERLVERFDRNRDVYTRPEYKEAQVRVEFIDPFFEALGWDVRNTKGYAEQYKDVVQEGALAIDREIGDRRGEGNDLGSLGNTYKQLGEPGRARELWEQALAIFEAIEDPNAERVRGWLAGIEA